MIRFPIMQASDREAIEAAAAAVSDSSDGSVKSSVEEVEWPIGEGAAAFNAPIWGTIGLHTPFPDDAWAAIMAFHSGLPPLANGGAGPVLPAPPLSSRRALRAAMNHRRRRRCRRIQRAELDRDAADRRAATAATGGEGDGDSPRRRWRWVMDRESPTIRIVRVRAVPAVAVAAVAAVPTAAAAGRSVGGVVPSGYQSTDEEGEAADACTQPSDTVAAGPRVPPPASDLARSSTFAAAGSSGPAPSGAPASAGAAASATNGSSSSSTPRAAGLL